MWIHLRRLVVSVMLAAMASLVLHSGAAAGLQGHWAGRSGCESGAFERHVHRAAPHDHHHGAHAQRSGSDHGHGLDRALVSDQAAASSAFPVRSSIFDSGPVFDSGQVLDISRLVETQPANDASAAGQPSDGQDAPCCGSVCAVAVPTFAPDAIGAPLVVAATLIPASQRGSGIDSNGLKRPPRAFAVA